MIKISLLLLLWFAATSANADSFEFSSGDQQVALVELYTSEGCSSCPPADRWMSGLKDDADLWGTIVPVAFHVDYWDYIGWTDRFAQPEFSNRQRRYAKEGNASTVYTPGLFLNGQEWRGWYWGRTASSSPESSVGDLWVEVDNSVLNAEYEVSNRVAGNLVLNIALLGLEIETRVKAGENNGKTLKHDFVVLDYHSVSMSADGDSGMAAQLSLNPPSVHAERYALAAWVSSTKSQVPIQATGGFLVDWAGTKDNSGPGRTR